MPDRSSSASAGGGAHRSETAVPAGVCLTHGAYSGSACPGCSTGGITRTWRPPVILRCAPGSWTVSVCPDCDAIVPAGAFEHGPEDEICECVRRDRISVAHVLEEVTVTDDMVARAVAAMNAVYDQDHGELDELARAALTAGLQAPPAPAAVLADHQAWPRLTADQRRAINEVWDDTVVPALEKADQMRRERDDALLRAQDARDELRVLKEADGV